MTRAGTPDRYEIFHATLQKKLPKFKLPLSADDRDTYVDLPVAFARAYDLGGFAAQISYAGPTPPDVPLTESQKGWLEDHLKAFKTK